MISTFSSKEQAGFREYRGMFWEGWYFACSFLLPRGMSIQGSSG